MFTAIGWPRAKTFKRLGHSWILREGLCGSSAWACNYGVRTRLLRGVLILWVCFNDFACTDKFEVGLVCALLLFRSGSL
jgi:hypothetical protein